MGFSGESLESPGHGFRNSLEGSSGDSGAIHWEILGGNTVSHVASIVVRSVREYGAGGSSEADPPSGHSSLSTHKSNQFEANTSLLLLRPSFFTYLPRFWSPSLPPLSFLLFLFLLPLPLFLPSTPLRRFFDILQDSCSVPSQTCSLGWFEIPDDPYMSPVSS